jgi:hypothetical protein
MPHGLTVLAAIRHGEEASLRDVLRPIGDDIKAKTVTASHARPHIDFVRSRRIHFARLAILRDPRRGPAATRLLFTSNYDGTLDSHIAELIEITSDMDAIWGRCEAYRGVAAFPAFIRAHAHEPDAFYSAFRDGTVETIQRAGALRRHVGAALEQGTPSALASLLTQADGNGTPVRRVAAATARRLSEAIGRFVRAGPIAADLVRAVTRYGFTTVFRTTNRITASLNRYPVFRFANWITRNRLPPRRSVYSSVTLDHCAAWQPLVDGDEIPAAFATPPTFREDVITQNQLTLVTIVDPQHVQRVKAVMAGLDSYATRLSPPGSLIGISTIHFVKWLLVDGDQRLILLSDYDGSWENYIDEFAEMILSGLDAIWETSLGYPLDGARDLPAFKRFLRGHQVPADVFFSAYPDQTILNVAANLRLARAMDTASEPLANLLPTL